MKKKNKKIPDFFLNAFYESKFKDNLFIVKASGSVIEDEAARDTLISNIRELTHHGIKVILIYGGGKAMDEESAARGISVEKVGGLRLNQQEHIDVLKHVVGGDLSLALHASMAKHDIDGLSFNAIPHEWADISLAPKTPEDRFTGGIDVIKTRPIRRLLKSTPFIACACVAITNEGIVCNINADKIATALASELQAHKLVFMSNVDGVKIDGKTALMITSDDIPDLIERKIVTDGMKVKMDNCLRALQAGVKRIHLINGLRENALYQEIFESIGPGTMILPEGEKEAYLNELEVHKAIGGE